MTLRKYHNPIKVSRRVLFVSKTNVAIAAGTEPPHRAVWREPAAFTKDPARLPAAGPLRGGGAHGLRAGWRHADASAS